MNIRKRTSFLICTALILVLFFKLTAHAQNFEGVIYYEIPEISAQGMGEMPYMVKGEKVRMEFGQGSQGGALIFMPEENQMAFILEALKGYMTMETEDYATETSDTEDNTSMENTGQTKTIAGRSCEVWQVTDQQKSYQLCVARGLGNFMMPENPMAQRQTPQWAKEAMQGGFMPLEVVEITGGKNEIKMKATRIEEKSLSDDLFNIPEGYNDMSSMMKQMMNQRNN